MNLNELRDEAYSIAREHGWHEEEHGDEHNLMLIITEIAEAVQADRNNDHADLEAFKKYEYWRDFQEIFGNYIKSTVEDELSDVVIRCLDLAGLRGINLSTPVKGTCKIAMPFTEYAFNTCHVLTYTHVPLAERINNVIGRIIAYCEAEGIDLEWFIAQKMKYNRLRPYRHGGLKY